MRRTRIFFKYQMGLLAALSGVLFLTGLQDKRIKNLEEERKWENIKPDQNTPDTSLAKDFPNKPEVRIRVLLTDSDFASIYHRKVTIRQKGTSHTWTKENLSKTVHIPEERGKVELLTTERAQGHPVYSGSVEIQPEKEGLLVINELPLEEYLCSVVPGEMPAEYEEEALKAQAVCARTYAWRQIQDKTMEKYGADVDDSVNFQVYGNAEPQSSSTEAVRATEGRIITQNGDPVEAYYFSTSSGRTVTDTVWGAVKPASYLKSVPCTFDQNMPWSSWKVEIPWQMLEERAIGKTETKGKLLSVEVQKTDQNAAVTGLKVITETDSFLLENENDIRKFLSPRGLDITEKDKTVITGGSFLPSAFFTLKEEQGKKVTIRGRGYGHGVGMSQNGANEMAKEGYSWQEILDYFFRDIQISQIPQNQ